MPEAAVCHDKQEPFTWKAISAAAPELGNCDRERRCSQIASADAQSLDACACDWAVEVSQWVMMAMLHLLLGPLLLQTCMPGPHRDCSTLGDEGGPSSACPSEPIACTMSAKLLSGSFNACLCASFTLMWSCLAVKGRAIIVEQLGKW